MREVIYQAVIPLDPKTKKNSLVIKYRKAGINGVYKRVGNALKYLGIPFISQSDIYKEYARECGYFLKGRKEPIAERVNVRCIFYRETKRRVDLPNLTNAICDILVDQGILADDNAQIVVSMDGSRVYYDKENPRTEIFIERSEDD